MLPCDTTCFPLFSQHVSMAFYTHVTNPELQPPWPPCSLRPSPDAPVASRAKAAISPASAWQWRRTLPSDRRWNYMEVYGDMDRSWNIHIYIAIIANKKMWFTWHDLSNKLKLDEFGHLMIAYLPRKNRFHQQKNGGCNLWGGLDPKHTISGHAIDNLMEHLTGTYPLRGCVSIFRWACRIGRFGFEQKLELILVLNWLNNLNSLILGLRPFAFCWANSFGPAGKA